MSGGHGVGGSNPPSPIKKAGVPQGASAFFLEIKKDLKGERGCDRRGSSDRHEAGRARTSGPKRGGRTPTSAGQIQSSFSFFVEKLFIDP